MGWIVLAILALPSSLVGYQHSRSLLRTAVEIWNKNENSTVGKVHRLSKEIGENDIHSSQSSQTSVKVDQEFTISDNRKNRMGDEEVKEFLKKMQRAEVLPSSLKVKTTQAFANKDNAYMQLKTGIRLGIEGRNNGCTASAVFMGLFATTTLNDFLLEDHSEDIAEQKNLKNLLRNTLVNPLRSKGFVSEKAFNQIRDLISNDAGQTATVVNFEKKLLVKLGIKNYTFKDISILEEAVAKTLGCKLSYDSLFKETIPLEDIEAVLSEKLEKNKIKEQPCLIAFEINANQDGTNNPRSLPPQTIRLKDRSGNETKMRLLSLQMIGLAHTRSILFDETEAYYYDSQSFTDKNGEIHPSVFKISGLVDVFPRDSFSVVKKPSSIKAGNEQMEKLFLTALQKDYPDALEKATLNNRQGDDDAINKMLDNNEKSGEELMHFLQNIDINHKEGSFGIDRKSFFDLYGILATKEIVCNYIKIS
ncbi:MAG: hypothetical protein C5B45_02810 [Chlamydiae bacterium]|nr:MAG: hypothetical protein C5B45_02810 [Chlamydiota bacterium]